MGVGMASKKKRVVHPNRNPFGGGASTKDRKAAKLATRRGVSQRVVRVAEGWKIEETAADRKRRSPDTWHTYDAAQLAMEDGYQMPALPVREFTPVMEIVDFVRYVSHENRQCLICGLLGEETRAAFSMRVRYVHSKRACIAICDRSRHDLAIGDRVNNRFEKREY